MLPSPVNSQPQVFLSARGSLLTWRRWRQGSSSTREHRGCMEEMKEYRRWLASRVGRGRPRREVATTRYSPVWRRKPGREESSRKAIRPQKKVAEVRVSTEVKWRSREPMTWASWETLGEPQE